MRKRATARREPSSTASEESTAATMVLRSPGVVRHSPHQPSSMWVWSMPTRSADPPHLVAPDLGEQRLGGDVVAAGDHPLGEGALAGAQLLALLLALVQQRRQDQHLDRAVAVALLRVEAEGLAAPQVDQLEAEVAAAPVEVVVEPVGEPRRLDPLDRRRGCAAALGVGDAEAEADAVGVAVAAVLVGAPDAVASVVRGPVTGAPRRARRDRPLRRLRRAAGGGRGPVASPGQGTERTCESPNRPFSAHAAGRAGRGGRRWRRRRRRR